MNTTIKLFSLLSLSNPNSHKFKISCTQLHQQHNSEPTTANKKRKPRPSFVDQVQEKWSRKIVSTRDSFPWQDGVFVDDDDDSNQTSRGFYIKSSDQEIVASRKEFDLKGPGVSAPWSHGKSKERKRFGGEDGVLKGSAELGSAGNVESLGRNVGDGGNESASGCNCDQGPTVGYGFDSEDVRGYRKGGESKGGEKNEDGCDTEVDMLGISDRERSEKVRLRGSRMSNKAERVVNLGEGVEDEKVGSYNSDGERDHSDTMNLTSGYTGKWYKGERVENSDEERQVEVVYSEKFEDEVDDSDAVRIGLLRDESIGCDGSAKESGVERDGLIEFPLGISGALYSGERDGKTSPSNTMLAEKTIPAHELQRLRMVSSRMFERIKVGSAGITQALVNTIHEKWKVDELVRLKFEEPLSLNMRRTHDTLESRTGGLVIWRSGSLIVLYRGLSYKLPCVRSFAEQVHNNVSIKGQTMDVVSEANHAIEGKNLFRNKATYGPDSTKYPQNLSKTELTHLTELNQLLDELGPRFTDWTGRAPLPVDADLLPSVVPGYKPPIRLLPYRIRPCLSNTQMTKIRRLARTMPPHFALGRNRELQGLAKAMVKLWEKNIIAKIAIKRGVLNTCNERMAEELKRLTGGTLVSRNKDFVVFYRGNDFLPQEVTEAVKERQTLAGFQQDQEDRARQMAASFIESTKARGADTIAGTLAETKAAKSRWGHQPSIEDTQSMMRESVLTKQASLVRYFENKLALAKRKFMKAEKALARVQADLEPAELPTDLETLSDEERFLFRKIGLSMKPYLLLGRRGVYDGTIENMHLHWKHRELVKLIVRGKTFAQLKHIAISLEAESGGVLVSLDKTSKGYAVIVYRGKNYQQPTQLRPKNLLSRREALARSIELQRREALKHHLSKLQGKIEQLNSELENMKSGDIDVGDSYSNLDYSSISDDEDVEDGGEEAYLEVYDSSNEDE